jgi:hypothetical protein
MAGAGPGRYLSPQILLLAAFARSVPRLGPSQDNSSDGGILRFRGNVTAPIPWGAFAARRLRAHLSLRRRPVFRQRPHLDTA